ncbi:MAG: nitrilase-related carbon-nitrogen hydrolase [Pyrinomonadaceae bacterium]
MMGGLVTSGAQGRGRNECVVYAPDGAEVVRYSKLHPFTLAGEAQAYVAGSAVSLFKLREFTISPFICYDLRFPEDFREAAQQGADLFTVIANWPASRIAHWTALLKARAIENQAYVIGVNRCGDDPQFSYTGQSVIFDPHGNMLAQAGSDEITISAELDLSAVIEYREKFPFLKDMHHR